MLPTQRPCVPFRPTPRFALAGQVHSQVARGLLGRDLMNSTTFGVAFWLVLAVAAGDRFLVEEPAMFVSAILRLVVAGALVWQTREGEHGELVDAIRKDHE